MSRFQLTRLMRGVTAKPIERTFCTVISTHTPHARRDIKNGEIPCDYEVFQLTRLMRGVTHRRVCRIKPNEFQLTRLMRGVTVELLAP